MQAQGEPKRSEDKRGHSEMELFPTIDAAKVTYMQSSRGPLADLSSIIPASASY